MTTQCHFFFSVGNIQALSGWTDVKLMTCTPCFFSNPFTSLFKNNICQRIEKQVFIFEHNVSWLLWMLRGLKERRLFWPPIMGDPALSCNQSPWFLWPSECLRLECNFSDYTAPLCPVCESSICSLVLPFTWSTSFHIIYFNVIQVFLEVAQLLNATMVRY